MKLIKKIIDNKTLDMFLNYVSETVCDALLIIVVVIVGLPVVLIILGLFIILSPITVPLLIYKLKKENKKELI